MELTKIMTKVRALIAQAEHEATDPAEARIYREKADALMLQYAIEEAMVSDAAPASERAKPGILEVAIAGGDNDVVGWIGDLARSVARYCRCIIRLYSRYDRETGQWMAKVYGHQGDLAYFEVLYTTVRLHMLGALRPEVNRAESPEDNAYRLHNAGYNWFEIAALYGWRKIKDLSWTKAGELNERPEVRDYDGKNDLYYLASEDRVEPSQKVGGPIQSAYNRAVKARGETPLKISPSGSKTYRRSAARGYSSRLSQRLRETERGRKSGGAEIILASAAQSLEDFYREDNAAAYARCPRCERLSSDVYRCEFCGQFIKDRPEECPKCAANPSGHCRDHPGYRGGSYRPEPFDQRAYRVGVDHANTADLGTQARTDSARKGELG
jgi:hypothetical protein